MYDLETQIFDLKPNPDKDKLKVFAAYSYNTNKYYLLRDFESIQKLIDAHKFLVGFNNVAYDNPILIREGFDNLQYKIVIDLRQIFKMRSSQMMIKKGMLGDLLMQYSLDFITKTIGLVDDETSKMKIDYNVFRKNEWTAMETNMILKYARRDIDVTKKLYEWVENYFASFKPYLNEVDVGKKVYLTRSLAMIAYKAICKELGWNDDKGEYTNGVHSRIAGGYVSFPAGKQFEGNIFALDFNCLPKNTMIKMWRDCKLYYSKPIQDIKVGDRVVNKDGMQIIAAIKEEDYNGELIEFELSNGKKISCTPNHKFPIYRNKIFMDVEAKDIIETDDFITPRSQTENNNPNYKGKIEQSCEICKDKYLVFPSQQNLKTCGRNQCYNKLRSINNAKSNLGKTKHNTPHLYKMSLDRTGKIRSVAVRNKISKAVIKAMARPEVRKKYLDALKNKDFSFMRTQEFHQKVSKTRMNNILNGKYVYREINFRSNWERQVAKNLDKNNIKWKYEYKTFKLKEGNTYTPDFYLIDYDKYIEVKGFMYKHSELKIKSFLKHNDLILVDNKEKVFDETLQWLK